MRAVLLAVVLLAPIGAPAMAGQGALERPDARQGPWWTRTTLDADRDGLDDALAPLLHGDAPLTVLLDYAEAPAPDEVDAARARAEVLEAFVHFPVLVVRAPAREVPALRDLPGVVMVEAVDAIRPTLAESVPLIGADQVWRKHAATGKGVVVAVLDDGAYEQHPDFSGKVVAS
ncbi:MAG TPA: hypothetical protein VHH36_00695, partial [Candidatus Thermoplasmatota archaeon]|nr:hypothetical protein [Candidatus Thermoplasmatota archaeon]